jgi:hypothetical protein
MPVLGGFFVLKFQSNLRVKMCSIFSKIADYSVAVRRQIRRVQLQWQPFDDSGLRIPGDHFDVGFQPGTQRKQKVPASRIRADLKPEITFNTKTGTYPFKRGVAKINQSISLLGEKWAKPLYDVFWIGEHRPKLVGSSPLATEIQRDI